MTFVDRETHCILAWKVSTKRSGTEFQDMLAESVQGYDYFSDDYPGYKTSLYWPAIHYPMKDKSQTYSVEGANADLRHYLAPDIFRVAISNKRIVKMTSTQVRFRYRSTRTGTSSRCSYGEIKTCSLSVEEFIRRFLQHVLPKGFVKVRYYGFFSPGLRTRLAAVREQLDGSQLLEYTRDNQSQDNESRNDDMLCPVCGQIMQKMKRIPACADKPP